VDQRAFWRSKIIAEYAEKQKRLNAEYDRKRAELIDELHNLSKSDFERTGRIPVHDPKYAGRLEKLKREFEHKREQLQRNCVQCEENWQAYRQKPPRLDVEHKAPVPVARETRCEVPERLRSPIPCDVPERDGGGSGAWKYAILLLVLIPLLAFVLVLRPSSPFHGLMNDPSPNYDAVPNYDVPQYNDTTALVMLDEIFVSNYGHSYYRTTPVGNEGLSINAVHIELDSIKSSVDFGSDSVYDVDYFDCSEMSAFLEYYFENKCGWDTYVLVGDTTRGHHAWVYIEDEYGNYVHVESTGLFVIDNYNWDWFQYTRSETHGTISSLYVSSYNSWQEWDWWNTRYASELQSLGYY
jgi:hypothetical protein